MKPSLTAVGGAMKLGFFVSGLTIASLAARFATADVAPGVQRQAEVRALAQKLDGRFSNDTLRKLFDAQNNPMFGRFDPGAKHAPDFAAIHIFEGAAPNLRLFELPPSSAQAVNAGVPFSLDPNPPAKPFVLTGSAEDKANALTCMTQAIYYEAGFEPGTGQQAVAQVVLNRMRHPIFPHSVCGVVYQGAAQKTGCQFSFTCDGSLAKKPNQAAWDRARYVAEQALNGYVMKQVGGATHYHTQWIVPWWQPTVAKVAQVGAHIFYRWPGTLGLPGAFNARYASNERMVATPNSPELATPVHDIDGRVHAEIMLADNAAQPPQTPRERLLALGAKGQLGENTEGASQQAPAASTSHVIEKVTLAAADLQTSAAPDMKVDSHIQPTMTPRSANFSCMSATCSRW